jgi:hypothetical protein
LLAAGNALDSAPSAVAQQALLAGFAPTEREHVAPSGAEIDAPGADDLVSPDNPAGAAVTPSVCRASIAAKWYGSAVGLTWRTKSSCITSVVEQTCLSRATSGSELANGDAGIAYDGDTTCRSTGSWEDRPAGRLYYILFLVDRDIVEPHLVWRRGPEPNSGIDSRSCTGYGTPVVQCTYTRIFYGGKGAVV